MTVNKNTSSQPNLFHTSKHNHIKHFITKGKQAYKKKQYEDAIQHYSSAIGYIKTKCSLNEIGFKHYHIQARLRRGKLAFQLGYIGGAHHDFQAILSEEKGHLEALFYQSKVAYHYKLYDEAYLHIKNIADKRPLGMATLSLLLKIQYERYLLDDAFTISEELLNANPKNVEALFYQAKIYFIWGWHAQAIENIETLKSIETTNTKTLLSRAKALYYFKQLDDALDDINTLLNLSPKHLEAQYMQAKVLYFQGKLNAACKSSYTLLRNSHNKLNGNYWLAKTYGQLGYLKRAESYIETIKQMTLRNLKQCYERADILYDLKQYPIAQLECDKMLANNKSHIPALLLRAKIRYQMKRFNACYDDLAHLISYYEVEEREIPNDIQKLNQMCFQMLKNTPAQISHFFSSAAGNQCHFTQLDVFSLNDETDEDTVGQTNVCKNVLK